MSKRFLSLVIVLLVTTTAWSAEDKKSDSRKSGPPANDLRLTTARKVVDAAQKCAITALVHNGSDSHYPGYVVTLYAGSTSLSATTGADGKATFVIPLQVTAIPVHATAQYLQSPVLNSNAFTCPGTGE